MSYINWITPWSRVLPAKLRGSQLVKIFSSFYGTRRFITGARHLSQINPVHAPIPYSKIHLNIVLPSKPESSKWSPSLWFHRYNPVYTSPLSDTCYMPCPTASSRFHSYMASNHKVLYAGLCFCIWNSDRKSRLERGQIEIIFADESAGYIPCLSVGTSASS